MSKFLSRSLVGLKPYTAGEQPKDRAYIKLNTNESPYPPAPGVEQAVLAQAGRLNLYSDPSQEQLKRAAGALYGLGGEYVFAGNGSDENLALVFRTFCTDRPLACPDVSYGMYPRLCKLFGINYIAMPLRKNFTVNLGDYSGISANVCLANPNAQTGLYLSAEDIEAFVAANPDRLVIVDEAYIDFGGKSCAPLVKKYNNLIVVQTMSKSRSLAGARVGFTFACPELIAEAEGVRHSFNPYNVNSMSMAAAMVSLTRQDYFKDCTSKIIAARMSMIEGMEKLGMQVLPSLANFVLAKSAKIGGRELYEELKRRGILVRYFPEERIKDYIRATVGTQEQTSALLQALADILKETT